MENNIFELTTGQLKEIAATLQTRIKEGLQTDGEEIRCLPTYIVPKTDMPKEKVLVLDLGGTNFRATVVDFTGDKPVVHDGIKKNLEEIMKAPEGKTKEELYAEIASQVSSLNIEGVKSIGYCFSYPCESTLDGDAILLYWTKGVTIKGLVTDISECKTAEERYNKAKADDMLIGDSLKNYLNKTVKSANFTGIKVINDTVASLFSGLTDKISQAHIGLIVGTGTNMAPFFPTNKIKKLNPNYKQKGLIPVNLESGNFYPPFLTIIDDKIDRYSDTPGAQRFEKAISGMYLGRLLEFIFSCDEFEANFDAEKLTRIMSYPDMYKEKYVQAAFWVYERAAKLVAASLAGLILQLIDSYEFPITDVRLAAEGSLFWSEDQKGEKNVKFRSYKDTVLAQLNILLKESGHGDITIHVEKMPNANMIGSAIAALS